MEIHKQFVAWIPCLSTGYLHQEFTKETLLPISDGSCGTCVEILFCPDSLTCISARTGSMFSFCTFIQNKVSCCLISKAKGLSEWVIVCVCTVIFLFFFFQHGPVPRSLTGWAGFYEVYISISDAVVETASNLLVNAGVLTAVSTFTQQKKSVGT